MSAGRVIIGSRGSLFARAGALSLLSLAACDGGGPAFTKLFTTEHFVYYVEEGVDPPCEGTGQWLERYYSANAGFLGATLPPGGKIEYYLVRDSESLAPFGCGALSEGCAPGTAVYTTHPIFPHEIVHANASLLGAPPNLFQEGLAEILGCERTSDTDGPIDLSAPLELLVETQTFMGHRAVSGHELYMAATSFVRYLIDEIGLSRFLSFYAHAPLLGSRKEIEAVFLTEMRVTLDDAFADWRKRPPPHKSDLCLRRMECDPSMPALAPGEVTLGCGPSGGWSERQEALFRFEVPEDRVMHVTTEPAAMDPMVQSNITFYRCSGGDAVGYTPLTAAFLADGEHVFLDPALSGRAFALDVPPGAYGAWIMASGDARLDVGAELRRSPMRDPTCKPAEEPLALSELRQTMLSSRWVERSCNGPWCPGRSWDVSIGTTGGALEAQVAFVSDVVSFSPAELYICSEPCPADASACEILDLSSGSPIRSSQTFKPGTVLHLGAPAAPDAGHFLVKLRVAAEPNESP